MIRRTGSEEVRSPIYIVDKILTVGIESSNSQAMDSGSDEADQKPKKKPGRKMMMTEPANVSLSPVAFMILTVRLETKSTESSCSTSLPGTKGSPRQGA